MRALAAMWLRKILRMRRTATSCLAPQMASRLPLFIYVFSSMLLLPVPVFHVVSFRAEGARQRTPSKSYGTLVSFG